MCSSQSLDESGIKSILDRKSAEAGNNLIPKIKKKSIGIDFSEAVSRSIDRSIDQSIEELAEAEQ